MTRGAELPGLWVYLDGALSSRTIIPTDNPATYIERIAIPQMHKGNLLKDMKPLPAQRNAFPGILSPRVDIPFDNLFPNYDKVTAQTWRKKEDHSVTGYEVKFNPYLDRESQRHLTHLIAHTPEDEITKVRGAVIPVLIIDQEGMKVEFGGGRAIESWDRNGISSDPFKKVAPHEEKKRIVEEEFPGEHYDPNRKSMIISFTCPLPTTTGEDVKIEAAMLVTYHGVPYLGDENATFKDFQDNVEKVVRDPKGIDIDKLNKLIEMRVKFRFITD